MCFIMTKKLKFHEKFTASLSGCYKSIFSQQTIADYFNFTRFWHDILDINRNETTQLVKPENDIQTMI